MDEIWIKKICSALRGRKKSGIKLYRVKSLSSELRKSTLNSLLDSFVRYRGQVVDDLAEKVEQAGAKLYETAKKTYEFLDYFGPKKPEENYAYR